MITRNIVNKDYGSYNTNTPFKDSGELRIGGTVIPANKFMSIYVQCNPGITLPIRLSAIEPVVGRKNACSVVFSDSAGNRIGACILKNEDRGTPYCSSAIRSSDGIFAGYMFYYQDLSPLLVGLCHREDSAVYTESGTFELLPQFCHAHISKGCRGVSVNGRHLYGMVKIIPSTYMRAEGTTVSPEKQVLEYGFIGKYESAKPRNGICRLSISDGSLSSGSYDVAGAHLIIRHTVTSNIRVTGDLGNVILGIVH